MVWLSMLVSVHTAVNVVYCYKASSITASVRSYGYGKAWDLQIHLQQNMWQIHLQQNTHDTILLGRQ